MRRRAMGSSVARRGSRPARTLAAVLLVGLLQLPTIARAADDCQPGTTVRVSVATDGSEANDRSILPAINGDGSVVAFKSYASNLVPNDSNQDVDVFVRDQNAATTERVTVSVPAGTQPNDNSYPPALDPSGRFVAFGSLATNLVLNDFNHSADVFLYDRTAHKMSVLTWVLDAFGVARGGGGAVDLPPSVNQDGSLIAFTSSADDLVANDNNEATDVFVYSTAAQMNELISTATVGSATGQSANGPSAGASISADGCVVAFFSSATNLVAGDTNADRDVFVRDRCQQTMERANVSSGGAQALPPPSRQQPLPLLGYGPAVSADGRFVAFVSDQRNLDDIDSGGIANIFVRDRQSPGSTMRVTNGLNGETANGPSSSPSISAYGRFVAFQSDASNLVDDDTNGASDVFVADLSTGAIRRVSVTASCQEANGASSAPQISGDGTTVAFGSTASNLVPDDHNATDDVFTGFNPLSVAATATATPTSTPSFTVSVATATETAATTATATPTAPTATATRPTPTPSIQTPTVPASTRTPTATPTAQGSTGLEPSRTPTLTPGGATPTPTSHTVSSGSSGGGCSCRIGTEGAPPADFGFLSAVALPLIVWALRPRRRSS